MPHAHNHNADRRRRRLSETKHVKNTLKEEGTLFLPRTMASADAAKSSSMTPSVISNNTVYTCARTHQQIDTATVQSAQTCLSFASAIALAVATCDRKNVFHTEIRTRQANLDHVTEHSRTTQRDAWQHIFIRCAQNHITTYTHARTMRRLSHPAARRRRQDTADRRQSTRSSDCTHALRHAHETQTSPELARLQLGTKAERRYELIVVVGCQYACGLLGYAYTQYFSTHHQQQ
jgi:hypothetical protein